MASYLSYFTSNSSSAPTQQQYQQAQPATSTWTNTVSSRLATLRKALTKGSEEDDPDNEDCSHVSDVLRAYYTQKGRPLPDWLPPDPKKPVVQAPPPQQYGQYGNQYGGNQYGGNQYGGNQYGAPTHSRGNSGGRGGLSDLWDSGPTQNAPVAQPQSLRAPRGAPQSQRSYESDARPASLDPYSSQQTSSARPSLAQRAGSYQSSTGASSFSKADRLRARLQGGTSGRSSPAPAQQNSDSYMDAGSYNTQSYGNNSGGPYNSSMPNQTDGAYGGTRDLGSGINSRGFGGPPSRPRPGGPR